MNKPPSKKAVVVTKRAKRGGAGHAHGQATVKGRAEKKDHAEKKPEGERT